MGGLAGHSGMAQFMHLQHLAQSLGSSTGLNPWQLQSSHSVPPPSYPSQEQWRDGMHMQAKAGHHAGPAKVRPTEPSLLHSTLECVYILTCHRSISASKLMNFGNRAFWPRPQSHEANPPSHEAKLLGSISFIDPGCPAGVLPAHLAGRQGQCAGEAAICEPRQGIDGGSQGQQGHDQAACATQTSA